MTYFWYKRDGKWACTFHKSYYQMGPPTYSKPSDWLRNAERQLNNPSTDVLSFKLEAQARNLIWC